MQSLICTIKRSVSIKPISQLKSWQFVAMKSSFRNIEKNTSYSTHFLQDTSYVCLQRVFFFHLHVYCLGTHVCPDPISNEQKSRLRLLRNFFKELFQSRKGDYFFQNHFQRLSNFKDKFHERLMQVNQLNGSQKKRCDYINRKASCIGLQIFL